MTEDQPARDLLTGCLTRVGAHRRVADGPVAVVYVDVDHFGLVNRAFGTATGLPHGAFGPVGSLCIAPPWPR